MVSVLLTVLKIVGITILVILGLILFILLLVLFVPIHYKAKGEYNADRVTVRLRASWLLHIAAFYADYDKGQAFHMRLKIFGITIYDNLKSIIKKSKNKKSKSTKTNSKKVGEIQAASTTDTFDEPETVSWEENDNKDIKGQELTANVDKTDASCKENEIKLNIFQKIKKIFIKIANIIKNIKFTFQKMCDTIVKIKSNIKYYLEILQLDTTKQAVDLCKTQLAWIVKKLLPKNFKVKLHLGFDDPSVMGEVLAVWGMFYPLHQGSIDIQPEFDKSVIEGDFLLKGTINVYVFVRAGCILFFDKNIKALIKHLKSNEK